MIIEDDTLTFSTGKKLYAHCGIVGLDLGLDDELTITYGYDGVIPADKLTVGEKRELAVFMIDMWQRYWGEIK